MEYEGRVLTEDEIKELERFTAVMWARKHTNTDALDLLATVKERDKTIAELREKITQLEARL
ncbi:hypothetical protein [Alicyclobacillus acidoterrestris]|uniref:Uncharacterized protein n=1 Tax=Alicyclobacillus acidoterrestris (strain ATCC 49025 / DSM 3922 / CIP 106132 / NCIMB 13137 / GD3B) TaxID=1356854 RepID=T0C506_ALIAG|nr:hypothetical protein [Alicyclobacillus acidoterrestris]EPZ47620.1 hypothetical protein N007_05020 [Alicyclobacillus acidoterrestris ATCC 49025]UNO48063.1 hypothetical protein K1I37_15425 [Alicyclobacillus acidoterrestris]